MQHLKQKIEEVFHKRWPHTQVSPLLIEDLVQEINELNKSRELRLIATLEYVQKACQCERFPSRKMKRGFDYGELHPILGKCDGGSRWLTPKDKVGATLKVFEQSK